MKATTSSLLLSLLLGSMTLASAQIAPCSAELPCEVTLGQVGSDPVAFDGIHVKVGGFLQRSGDDLLLLANQSASLNPQGDGAMLVTDDPVTTRLIFGDDPVAGWVAVSGRFVSARPDRLPLALGVIEDPVITTMPAGSIAHAVD